MIKVTKEEVEINKIIGWYLSKDGIVRQVTRLYPREERIVGKLKNPNTSGGK